MNTSYSFYKAFKIKNSKFNFNGKWYNFSINMDNVDDLDTFEEQIEKYNKEILYDISDGKSDNDFIDNPLKRIENQIVFFKSVFKIIEDSETTNNQKDFLFRYYLPYNISDELFVNRQYSPVGIYKEYKSVDYNLCSPLFITKYNDYLDYENKIETYSFYNDGNNPQNQKKFNKKYYELYKEKLISYMYNLKDNLEKDI